MLPAVYQIQQRGKNDSVYVRQGHVILKMVREREREKKLVNPFLHLCDSWELTGAVSHEAVQGRPAGVLFVSHTLPSARDRDIPDC